MPRDILVGNGKLLVCLDKDSGYPLPAQRFYNFAADAMEEEGYLLHKYNPDGILASSWHLW